MDWCSVHEVCINLQYRVPEPNTYLKFPAAKCVVKAVNSVRRFTKTPSHDIELYFVGCTSKKLHGATLHGTFAEYVV
jgi:hypothetical protein